MANEFLNRKFRTIFAIHDVQKTGEISEADHMRYIENMISLGHMKEDRAAHCRNTNKKIWVDYYLPGDANGDGIVSFDEFVTQMNNSTEEQIRESSKAILGLMFEAIDANGNDNISKVEFNNFFKSININDESMATTVFQQIDFNNDNLLSKDEFVDFGIEFYTSKDEKSPSKMLFGPLAQ